MFFYVSFRGFLRPSLLLSFIFLASHLHADCEAPALKFPQYSEKLLGFELLNLSGDKELQVQLKRGAVILPVGDFGFALFKKPKPQLKEIKAGVEISKRILNNFKSSEFYMGAEKQVFNLVKARAYDLDGNGDMDLILFAVSPGANTYTGAIAIVNHEWHTLIAPSCY